MSVDIDDPSDNTPIDLFAPRVTVSQEGYAFPIENFIPSQKQEPLDEPASLEPEVENNVEVNPNKTDGTLVDVSETGVVDPKVSLGMESDGLTDTPIDPAPLPTNGDVVDRVSLESDIEAAAALNEAYSNLRQNGGISRSDVIALENEHPGLITSKQKINAFSSVVSLCGYEVSCESIGTRIMDLIERIIAAIGRCVDRLLNADRFKTPTFNSITGTSSIASRWKDIETLAARLDSIKSPKNIGARVPDSTAAQKSSTLKHFVRLYSVELIQTKVTEVSAGYNLVLSGTAIQGLTDINRELERILTEVTRSTASGAPINLPEIETVEFRKRYENRVKGMVPNIEKIVSIKTPEDVIASIRKHVTTLNTIKSDLEKKKTNMVGDVNATNSLKSISKAIVAAEACTVKMGVVLDAFNKYNNIVGMSLDQVNNKLQIFKL